MAENIPEWAKQAKQEAADAEQRKKDTAAYDKASPEPDTTFGKMKKLNWNAKTGIEEKAVDDAFTKQYKKSGPVQNSYDDDVYQRKIDSAGREARDEIRRETKGKAPKAYAKGGSASSRADGIAQRGKTRGKIVMCGGGMYKK